MRKISRGAYLRLISYNYLMYRKVASSTTSRFRSTCRLFQIAYERGFLILMYCDLLRKSWFPNYVVMCVRTPDYLNYCKKYYHNGICILPSYNDFKYHSHKWFINSIINSIVVFQFSIVIDRNKCFVHTVKSRAVDRSYIQFWNFLDIHSGAKCLAWVKKCCHVWLDQS